MKCVKRKLSKIIDKPYNDKFYKINKQLMDILIKGEQCSQVQVSQRIAKEKLREFYNVLKSTKERKEYVHRGSHLSYVYLLVNVKYAFMKLDFIWVCHELQNILYYEDIFQNRIKYNVLKLIEEYIEVV